MFVNQLAPLLVSALLTSTDSVAPSETFSRTPHEVLAWAAEAPEAPTAAAEILLDSTEVVIEADGSERWTTVLAYRVLDLDALPQSLKEVRADWGWTSSRPEVKARVIRPDGSVHWLDASLLVEVAPEERADVYSDQHALCAPLPALARGAVVEVKLQQRATPWAKSGANHRFVLQNRWPTRTLRVHVTAPLSRPLKVTETGASSPYELREDGRGYLLALEVHDIPAIEEEREPTGDKRARGVPCRGRGARRPRNPGRRRPAPPPR